MRIKSTLVAYVGLMTLTMYFALGTSPVYPYSANRGSQAAEFYQVNLSADDASEDNGCGYSLTDPEVYLGRCSNGSDITAGFRFEAVSIPTGENICSATLIFTGDGPYTNDLNLRIIGESAANSQSFSTGSPPSSRSLTGANIRWDVIDDWNLGNTVQSPNIAPIIEEIVHLPGWANGQPITLLIENNGSTGHRRVISFDRGNFLPARLHLETSPFACNDLPPDVVSAPSEDDEHFVADRSGLLDLLVTESFTFTIPIDRYYFHPNSVSSGNISFDAAGFLTPSSVDTVINDGGFPATAQLSLSVYDVDENSDTNEGCSSAEDISVDINGIPILNGIVTGSADRWEIITFEFPTSYLKLPQEKGNLAPPLAIDNDIQLYFSGCSDGISVAWGEIALTGAIRPTVTIPGWLAIVRPNDDGDITMDSGDFGLMEFYVIYGLDSHIPIQIPSDYESGIKPLEDTYPLVVNQIAQTRLEFGVDQVNIFAHSRGGLFARRALNASNTADSVEHLFTFATPHHGSRTNAGGAGGYSYLGYGPCNAFSGTDFDDCQESAVSLSTESVRAYNFSNCTAKQIRTPYLYEIPELEATSNVHRYRTVWRDCEPNSSTWEHPDVKYFSIVGDNDGVIGRTGITGIYPWTSYDWQTWGTFFPRANSRRTITEYVPPTTINETWDYVYDCTENVGVCHSEVADVPETFCFAVGELLKSANGADISKIITCRNLANGTNSLNSTSNLQATTQTSSTTHDLILGDDTYQEIYSDSGTLQAQEYLTRTFPISSSGEALITLTSFPELADWSLLDPNGTAVAPDGLIATTSVVTGTDYGNFYQYKVISPTVGVWTVGFTSTFTNSTGFGVSAAVSDTLDFAVWTEDNTVSANQTRSLYAALFDSDDLFVMTATLTYPDGATQTVNLRDDGTNGDETAGDGYYTASFSSGTTDGYIEIAVIAQDGLQQRYDTTRLAVVSNNSFILNVNSDETPDSNSDGLYDDLIIKPRFFPLQAGHYSFHADLVNADGFVAKASYSTRTALQNPLPTSSIFEVPLTFSGADIFASGKNGPYTMTNVLTIDENGYSFVIDEKDDLWTTSAYTADQFEGTRTIRLQDVDYQTPDEDSNGFYDNLTFNLTAQSDFTGTFRVSGQLVDEDGNTISWAESELEITETGSITPSLVFSGTMIRLHQADGQYDLQNLTVFRNDGLNWSQYQLTTTISYSYTQFDRLASIAVDGLTISRTNGIITIGWNDMGTDYEVWLHDEPYTVPNTDCLTASHCIVQATNSYLINVANLPAGLRTATIIGAQGNARSQSSDILGIFTFELDAGD